MLAVASKNPDLVKLFLKYGANPNISKPAGTTPLIMSVSQHTPDIAKQLLGAGANVNMCKSDGETPLMVVATLNDIDTL